MKKKETIYTCIDLTKEEAKILIDLLCYEHEQLTGLIDSGETEYKRNKRAVLSILKKLDA